MRYFLSILFSISLLVSNNSFAQFSNSLQYSIFHDNLLEFSSNLDFKSSGPKDDLVLLDFIQSKIILLEICQFKFPGNNKNFDISKKYLSQLMDVSIIASEFSFYDSQQRTRIIKPQINLILKQFTEEQKKIICSKFYI